MSGPASILAASILAAVLSIGGAIMARADNGHVTLDCPDARMCAALRDALVDAPPLPVPLTLILVVERRTDHALDAHLAWQGARRGRGKTVSLNVMDTILRPSMIDRFIASLVRHSALPR